MQMFHARLRQLVSDLNELDGVDCLMPGGSFYAFPSVVGVCNRLGISSHGLAMYLLEAADDQRRRCLPGRRMLWRSRQGFIRLSVAQPPERLAAAVAFMKSAFAEHEQVIDYVNSNPKYRLSVPYR